MAKLHLPIAAIYHSGKLRAQQTADLFAGVLAPAMVQEIKGLAPLDDPAVAKALIEQEARPLMLVGHLPHLSRLVSALIGTDREIVKFQMGGVVALVKAEPGWQVAWMLTPEIARQLEGE
jgi:phosphohistidine phosphatase